MRVLIAVSTTGVGNQRAESFHQVEGQTRTAEARLMKEADVRVETHRVADHYQIAHQQTIRQRPQRIHRITRWAPIAMLEIECGRFVTVVHSDHASELLEVQPSGRGLNAKQRVDAVGSGRRPRQTP
jgi:hypothetical protein